MKNIVSKPTRINSLIDVVFTDLKDNEVCSTDSHLSDHTFQIAKLQLPLRNEDISSSTIIYRDFLQ